MELKLELEDALETISDVLSDASEELKGGLPGGSFEEWNYDEKLVRDIALACLSWQSRVSPIQDPYSVWFFDGSSWERKTKDMYQEEAYKEWYRLTSGGKEMNNSSCKVYYHLCSSKETLLNRHCESDDEDDFSIGYLLNKSFNY